jgi:3-hydroxyacyl-CoA dehydrogenase
MGLSVTEVDKMTGPILGRAKSATFRTCDVVGLDTLVLVSKGLHANCPNDEARHCSRFQATSRRWWRRDGSVLRQDRVSSRK